MLFSQAKWDAFRWDDGLNVIYDPDMYTYFPINDEVDTVGISSNGSLLHGIIPLSGYWIKFLTNILMDE